MGEADPEPAAATVLVPQSADAVPVPPSANQASLNPTGFNNSLGHLAGQLNDPAEVVSKTVDPAIIQLRKIPAPQLASIRSDLQSLLVDLDQDLPFRSAALSAPTASLPTASLMTDAKPKAKSPSSKAAAKTSTKTAAPAKTPELFSTRLQLEFVDATSKSAPANAIKNEAVAEPCAENDAAQFAILSGKTIGVIGFSPVQSRALGHALAAQHCSFLTLTETDAEFRKGSTDGCDVLIIQLRAEAVETGSGEVSPLLSAKKPALLIGEPALLMSAAMLAQGNPREFVETSAPVEESIWRAAVLLSGIPGPKPRAKKKNRQMQIVVGDDDPSSRTLVHAILAQEGMKCHSADNGAQALALARSKAADVMIVDVNMPGLDGFQVLAEIKRDPTLTGMRVILLTTRQAEADVLRGFGLGADDYVTKPFSPLELAARVKRLLGRRT